MLKKIGIAILFLALVFIAYLYGQAAKSQSDETSAAAYTAPPAGDPALPSPRGSSPLLRIAFGSCNDEDDPQDYWATIARHDPDTWLWLGDNVYADTDDMDAMRADYLLQKQNPHYARFTEQVPLVYGTWDDHDYGVNDGGSEWVAKDGAKELLLAFLDVPAGAPVRDRPGLYQSYMIDGVKVILLDTRYFRDELAPATRAGARYGENTEGDILGEAQWRWLEEELRDSDARAHLIASSIQVLPTDHGYEKWANFPTARRRLLDLLAETLPALPLLLSGDRHLAEFSTVTVDDGYQIYEMTSSGLTHSYSGSTEANDKRLGPLVTEKNYGLLHFQDTNGELRLRAEVHAIDNDAVLTSLMLPAGTPATENNSNMSRTLKPCPDSPNCISTQTDQADKKRDPISFGGTAAEAKEKLKKVVGAMPRTKLVEEDGNYLHYTFKTWPIPFIDDVEFVIDEEEKVIHYRSASRVGHSDLGVNGKRMAKVVKLLE